MSSRSKVFCVVCRGPTDDGGSVVKCVKCSCRFHNECVNLPNNHKDKYSCDRCENDKANGYVEKANPRKKLLLSRNKQWKHRLLYERSQFIREYSEDLLEFCDAPTLNRLMAQREDRDSLEISKKEYESLVIIKESPSYIQNATLREYQIEGVSLMSSWFLRGVGGILADEMGLGKTIQTIAFLAGLKDKLAITGPHLVVTPLAVLQNWANEFTRFAPHMTFKKMYGSKSEREQIFNDEKAHECAFDVYLTTYDTLITEEAFFSDSWPWVTITIDEGHRIKNENAKLRKALNRVRCNFRMLLTGTPLQNNLHELWALLDYILPEVFHDSTKFDEGVSIVDNTVDRNVCLSARRLLDTHMMLRRVKKDVEKLLLPKIQCKISVPITPLQRKWYKLILEGGGVGLSSVMTLAQLQHTFSQLRKVVNCPKQIYIKKESFRQAEQKKIDSGHYHGCEFTKPSSLIQRPAEGTQEWINEEELRGLEGESLIKCTGKLIMLDRLLLRLRKQNSRCLIFSQFTETLDVLEEYLNYRFGANGEAYYRLDGSTNRILREMNTRSFNHPESKAWLYIISTTAGGMGINLATANSVILYDSSWNPQHDLQAQDRAHRIGQKKQATVYRLVTENTFEERILQMAQRKMNLDGLVIANEGSASLDHIGDGLDGQMTLSELSSLLGQQALVMSTFNAGKDMSSLSTEELDEKLDEFIANPIGCGDDTKEEEEGEEEVPREDTLTASSASGYKCGACGQPKKGHVCMARSKPSSGPVSSSGGAVAPPPSSSTPLGPALDQHDEEDPDDGKADVNEYFVLYPRHKKGPAWKCVFVGTHGRECGRLFEKEESGGREAHLNTHTRPFRCLRCPARRATQEKLDKHIRFHHDGIAFVEGEDESDDGGMASRLSSRTRKPPNKFTPLDYTLFRADSGPRKPKVHEDVCFCCHDGGELVECNMCPKVYHTQCLGLSGVPKGTWTCPWHSCIECDRNSSSSGGMQFRCMDCPITYCFDCYPTHKEMVKINPPAALLANLERRGFPASNSILWMRCDECIAVKGKYVEVTHTREDTAALIEKARDIVFKVPVASSSKVTSSTAAKPKVLHSHHKFGAGQMKPLGFPSLPPPCYCGHEFPLEGYSEAMRSIHETSQAHRDTLESRLELSERICKCGEKCPSTADLYGHMILSGSCREVSVLDYLQSLQGNDILVRHGGRLLTLHEIKVRLGIKKPVDVAAPVVARKSKEERAAGLPKNPQNPAAFFAKEKREGCKRDDPMLKHEEISKKISEEWKAVPASERVRYIGLAAQDKIRYNEEMRVFNETAAARGTPFSSGEVTMAENAPVPGPIAFSLKVAEGAARGGGKGSEGSPSRPSSSMNTTAASNSDPPAVTGQSSSNGLYASSAPPQATTATGTAKVPLKGSITVLRPSTGAVTIANQPKSSPPPAAPLSSKLPFQDMPGDISHLLSVYGERKENLVPSSSAGVKRPFSGTGSDKQLEKRAKGTELSSSSNSPPASSAYGVMPTVKGRIAPPKAAPLSDSMVIDLTED